MINREAKASRFCQGRIEQLQAAMLAASTLGELYALMEDYSYLEVMTVYNQLPPVLQLRFNNIYLGDTQAQMAAIYSTSNSKQFSEANSL